MKRNLSETISCCDEIQLHATRSLLKRRRTNLDEPIKACATHRVRFATPLVQSTEIAAVVHQVEKEIDEPIKACASTHRVRFATPLVQRTEIPAVIDQVEKEIDEPKIDEPIKACATHRVRFATPLVQRTEIPAVIDQVEKERLFYSKIDFARFALKERVRRDALVLTVTLYREQRTRIRRGLNAIPATSVLMMYHKVLSRTEDISSMLEKGTRSQKYQWQRGRDKQSRRDEKESCISKLESRIVVARCA
jgi:hypothetical protein